MMNGTLASAEITTIFGVFCMTVLIPWRFSRRRTLLFSVGATLLFVAITALFFAVGLGEDELRAVFMPTTLLLSYYLSLYRDVRVLFCNASSMLFTVVGAFISEACTLLFPGRNVRLFLLILVYFIFLLLSYFVFRKSFLDIMQSIERGWLKFCAVPFAISITMMAFFGYYNKCGPNPFGTASILFLCLTAFVVYYLFYALFRQLRGQHQVQQENFLLQTQVSAMEKQVNLIQAHQEQRILQHDLRHYAHTIVTCVTQGAYDEASENLMRLCALVDRLQPAGGVRYCHSLTLNAALSHYIQLAENAGIQVSAQLDLPEDLPVDKLELAVVFANCIENAVNACSLLPEGTARILRLTSYQAGRGQFIEIANTCANSVEFDPSTGLPLTRSVGHGTGSLSIAGFVQKYHALLTYEVADGWFKLRILL